MTLAGAVYALMGLKLSKNGLLAANGSKERRAERKRAMDKQLQLPSATQPAGISFSFFKILSACSVKCFCLPDSCMLHVPVELSHTHTHTPAHWKMSPLIW